MATVYGVNRTLIEAGGPASIEPEMTGGLVKWIYDEYEASALAVGSVIEVCKDLPAEARIVDWIIDHDQLAPSATTIAFGTNADFDEFMVHTATTAADTKNMTDDGVDSTLGFEIEAGDGQTLIITYSGTSTGTGTIKVGVAYVAKG